MMIKLSLSGLLILSTLVLTACNKAPEQPVTIAINPWPGYEFLHLAKKKGFFKQAGANIKIAQLPSLANAQRAYTNGHVDGLASTIIEAVQAEALGGKPLKIILIPDYSNGGDVIITHQSVTNMAALKGKVIGCEVSSLGIYLLQRALESAGLSLDDVTIINTEQADGENSMLAGTIDAYVTYPPVSIALTKHPQFKTIFSSADIPNEIIDTVSLSEEAIKNNPQIVSQIRQAWQLALDYTAKNPDDAYDIMASREGVTPGEFKDVLGDLSILNTAQQETLFNQPEALQQATRDVCKTLVHVGSIKTNCDSLPNIIYKAP